MKDTASSKFHISLIQPNIIWQDSDANIALIDRLMKQVSMDSNLILMPEMWNTGFTLDPNQVATQMDGPIVANMVQWAAEKVSLVGSSVIIRQGENYYNRFVLVDANGPIATYDKRHLFTPAGEREYYTAGQDKVICSAEGWDMCLNICYDLRFPVWSRNTERYDMLIYVANWPSPRHYAWKTLLKARAIENQCYVIGSNRVGTDDNDLSYLGGSAIIDYLGIPIVEMDDQEGIAMGEIEMSGMLAFRSKLDFLADQD